MFALQEIPVTGFIQVVREFGPWITVIVAIPYLSWRVGRAVYPMIKALVDSHIEFVRALQGTQEEIRDRLTAIEDALVAPRTRRRHEGRTKSGDDPR